MTAGDSSTAALLASAATASISLTSLTYSWMTCSTVTSASGSSTVELCRADTVDDDAKRRGRRVGLKLASVLSLAWLLISWWVAWLKMSPGTGTELLTSSGKEFFLTSGTKLLRSPEPAPELLRSPGTRSELFPSTWLGTEFSRFSGSGLGLLSPSGTDVIAFSSPRIFTELFLSPGRENKLFRFAETGLELLSSSATGCSVSSSK